MGLSFKSKLNLNKLDPERFELTVAVGYSSEEHHSGMPVSELAARMEAGDANTPARPHLKPGLEAGMVEIRAAMREHLRDAFGHFKSGWASGVADAAREAVIDYVYSGALAPNAPYTVEKKGSDQPLVETGELLHLLEAVVLKGKG
jgi:hypothetical protein